MATKRGEKYRFEMTAVKKKEPDYIEKSVLSSDTLPGIALLYNTTVAELKKINHIRQEAELHARRTIKVPARGILINLEPEVVPILVPQHGDSDENLSEEDGQQYINRIDANLKEIKEKAQTVAANSVIDTSEILPPFHEDSGEIKWWKIFVPCFATLVILPIVFYYFFRHVPHDHPMWGSGSPAAVHEH